MPYNFTADLETGNGNIDKQHKQLFDTINSLLDACSQGKGRAELEKTTNFLFDYTLKHFADEEALMLRSTYPEYKAHKQYHDTFKKSVSQLMEQIKTEGATIPLVGKVNLTIADWLVTHIKREDMKFVGFLKNK